jgi:hypothetical protein
MKKQQDLQAQTSAAQLSRRSFMLNGGLGLGALALSGLSTPAFARKLEQGILGSGRRS